MRRLSASLSIALLLAIVAWSASAQDPPHNIPNIKGPCGNCHTPHHALGGGVINKAAIADVCYSCHSDDLTVTDTLVDADQAVPGPGLPSGVAPSGTSHRWDSGSSGHVQAVVKNGNGSVQSTGMYTGRYAKTYIITVTQSGDANTAVFAWTDTLATGPTPTPVNTPVCVATPTPTSTPTGTPTSTPTATPTSGGPTSTPTSTPTVTPTSTPTNTAPTSTTTSTPTNTPTYTPSNTPTVTPTNTPTNTATNTPACVAACAGWLNPSANQADTGGDGNGFEVNPTYAYADGGAGYAESVNSDTGERHSYSNYNITIPADCTTINSIQLRLDWWMDSVAGTNSTSAELSWNAGINWTSQKTDTQETTAEHTWTSTADGWGRTWSVTELSSANFRVRLVFNTTVTAREWRLDWVPVDVCYGP